MLVNVLVFPPWRTWRLAADFGLLAYAQAAVMAHCVCSSLREVVLRCLPFQKRVSFTELTLDWDDGLNMCTSEPSRIESESVGSFYSYDADALASGPHAREQSRLERCATKRAAIKIT